MRVLLILLVLAAAACDAPSPDMRGAVMQRIQIDGSQFTVYRLGNRAEAIRTNVEYRDRIMDRGYRAIEQATGCRIRAGSFDGDPAMMRAKLACPP